MCETRLRVSGFSLVEVLVVIGITGLLIAILLPTVAAARRAARNAQCASRLRELVSACTMYLNEQKVYPAPCYVTMQGDVIPNFVPFRLLNDLSRYLGYEPIADTASLSDLPMVAECPFAQEYDTRGPVPLPGGVIVVTGYQYGARMEEQPNPRGVLIQPERLPRAKGTRRAVLWADVLGWYSGSGFVMLPPGLPPSYAFFHKVGTQDPAGLGWGSTRSLRGQHRGWTDGSVEWIPAKYIRLDSADFDTAASYKVGVSGNYFTYFWF